MQTLSLYCSNAVVSNPPILVRFNGQDGRRPRRFQKVTGTSVAAGLLFVLVVFGGGRDEPILALRLEHGFARHPIVLRLAPQKDKRLLFFLFGLEDAVGVGGDFARWTAAAVAAAAGVAAVDLELGRAGRSAGAPQRGGRRATAAAVGRRP